MTSQLEQQVAELTRRVQQLEDEGSGETLLPNGFSLNLKGELEVHLVGGFVGTLTSEGITFEEGVEGIGEPTKHEIQWTTGKEEVQEKIGATLTKFPTLAHRLYLNAGSTQLNLQGPGSGTGKGTITAAAGTFGTTIISDTGSSSFVRLLTNGAHVLGGPYTIASGKTKTEEEKTITIAHGLPAAPIGVFGGLQGSPMFSWRYEVTAENITITFHNFGTTESEAVLKAFAIT